MLMIHCWRLLNNYRMTTRKRKVKAVLIDLSGTLHIEDFAIPGAPEALNRLRKTGVLVKFVTNTTKESRKCLYNRLVKLGFKLNQEEILSSLWAASNLVRSRKLRPMLLIDDDALEDFAECANIPEKEHNSVVIGLAPKKFNYEHLNKAFRLLLSGAPLIAIHQSRYYKRSDGLALGPGAFVKGLEFATEVKPEVVGKPCPTFFRTALGDVDPADAIMIGDDVRDDIDGAQSLGMRGFLVKTGKYRSGDESQIHPGPSQVLPSFTHAVDVIIKELQ